MDADIRALERLEREREGRPRRIDPTRRVSMADVAALAGVSGQTVSRVVNDSPRVDPQTRARVERAMARLGYRPHRAARALRTGRTQTVGLIATTLAHVGNSRMLQAVSEAAADRSYALVVVTLRSGERIADAFERLRDQGIDGGIVLNEATPLARAADPEGLELVVVDSPPDDRFTIVQSDHAGGAAAATRYLIELGHDTVAHIAGPATSFAAAERERGWREALETAGRAIPAPVRGDWSAASGYRAAGGLLDQTAVFAANDQMALGALRAFGDAGHDVPGRASVIGFDDIAEASEFRPPLTTVRQQFDVIGERALALLADRIEHDAARRLEVIPAPLIVRESTGSVRRA